jgi:hypothetical protein
MDVVVAHLRIENRKLKQKDAKNAKKRERLVAAQRWPVDGSPKALTALHAMSYNSNIMSRDVSCDNSLLSR